MSPTDSCAWRAARWIRGTTMPMTSAARTSTATVTASSTASTKAINTIVASSVSAPVKPDTSVCEVTWRSSVVSAVTLDIRSPGSFVSIAGSRSLKSRSSSVRLAASTTDSPVRSRT